MPAEQWSVLFFILPIPFLLIINSFAINIYFPFATAYVVEKTSAPSMFSQKSPKYVAVESNSTGSILGYYQVSRHRTKFLGTNKHLLSFHLACGVEDKTQNNYLLS